MDGSSVVARFGGWSLRERLGHLAPAVGPLSVADRTLDSGMTPANVAFSVE